MYSLQKLPERKQRSAVRGIFNCLNHKGQWPGSISTKYNMRIKSYAIRTQLEFNPANENHGCRPKNLQEHINGTKIPKNNVGYEVSVSETAGLRAMHRIQTDALPGSRGLIQAGHRSLEHFKAGHLQCKELIVCRRDNYLQTYTSRARSRLIHILATALTLC